MTLSNKTWAAGEALGASHRTDHNALPTYAWSPGVDEALLDEIRRGKGGVVGTDGKGVVAFRFDHNTDEFLADVWPEMLSRGLPGSFGVVTSSIGDPAADYEPTTAGWSDLQDANKEGLEMWAHSRTHSDPGDVGTTLSQEIEGSKSDIEDNSMRVVGWTQPGSPATYGSAFSSPAAMNTEAGRLIRRTFGLYETSAVGSSRRTLPSKGCWGGDHITIDTLDEATIKGHIDAAVAYKTGVELMLHADVLDVGSNLTTAELTNVLDYVETKRAAGELEVLTSSGLAFADPSTSQRLDLIVDGTFVGLDSNTFGYGWDEESAGSWTIEATGGLVGDEHLRVPSSGTRCSASFENARGFGVDGHTFLFTGACRSEDVGGATARVRIISGSGVILDKTDIVLSQSSSWTRVYVPFSVYPYLTNRCEIQIGRASGGAVDWDDVHAYAI